jgi:CPA2 family monovalent cation:H+ antiporter-2
MDQHLIQNIAIALGAAFIGGTIAKRLGIPVIVGYLLAGIVVGPSTPGVDANIESVRTLAELGVAFLMFSLGVEFSLKELLHVRRLAVGAGTLQVVITTLFGIGIGAVLGWSWSADILLGMIIALSSSVVAIKLLMLRGEMETPHGRATGGLAVLQDLSLVPMLIILPLLAGEQGNIFLALLRSVGLAIVVLAGVIILGMRLVPRLLNLIAETRSRELFLLAVIVIALGTSVATDEAGLSFALGAFLAGLIVSESDFSHQVLADILPLRDAFATLFFVSIGMLVDVQMIFDRPFTILGVILLATFGKLLIFTFIVRGFGIPALGALLTGALLAQIGEVSFILASEGLDRHIISAVDYRFVLVVSLGTLILSPLLLGLVPRCVGIARRLRPDMIGAMPITDQPLPRRHTIVCGYGRLGVELVETLQRRDIPHVIIDNDPSAVRRAIASGTTSIYGDAGNTELLQHLGIETARVLAVVVTDPLAAESAVVYGRKVNPRLHIIARARSREQARRLKELGATEVVQPEFEAGMEIIRHVLHVHGLDQRQVSSIVQRRRERFYPNEFSDELAEGS